MIKFRLPARPGVAPYLQLRVVAAGIAMTGMLIAVAGCSSAAPSTTGTAYAGQPVGATGDCDSLTTCYAPHQIQVAYGIQRVHSRGCRDRGLSGRDRDGGLRDW